jgi:hypothetical protein
MTGIVLAWFIVNWIAVLAILYNVVFHRAAAYKYAGTSKLRWFGAGAVCIAVPVGLPAQIYFLRRYRFKIREFDREKLKRREEKRARTASARSAARSPSRPASALSDAFKGPSEPQRLPCSHCSGRGHFWAPDTNNPDRETTVICPACGGKGSR